MLGSRVKPLLLLLLVLITGPFLLPSEALAKAHPVRDRILAEAEERLGKDYGHGKHKLTCSEFTSKVYAAATGHKMSWSEDEQLRHGWNPNDRKPGDLVYYKEYRDGTPVTHVAIWYGNGKIIHASNYFDEVVVSYHKYIIGYKTEHRIR
jgi:cell wall-associated NlpC family hydrolase